MTNLTYETTNEHLNQLKGTIDYEAMMKVGRMLNVITIAIDQGREHVRNASGAADRRKRKREVALAKGKLCFQALALVEDLYPTYRDTECFAGLEAMLAGNGESYAEQPPVDFGLMPFRIYAEDGLASECINCLEDILHERLDIPTDWLPPNERQRRRAAIDGYSAIVDSLTQQFLIGAVEFVYGMTGKLSLVAPG